MIILDTNVVSELMRGIPSENVISWLDQQEFIDLFVTSVTIAEIYYGLDLLPKGKRKSLLEEAFKISIMDSFAYRVLLFDVEAARGYGKIMSHRKNLGKPMSVPDGQIAAIARVNNAIVATRNISDFSHCSLELINPFS